MWQQPARLDVGTAALNFLKDVEVVQDVLKRAVVRQSFQEGPDGVLCLHVLCPRRVASPKIGDPVPKRELLAV
jgi:hypothetical protein